MNVWCLALLLLLTPTLVSAQTLHGYPGKTAYASPAEWPLIDGQCHWVPGSGLPIIPIDPGGGLPPVMPPLTLVYNMAHTHVGIKGPVWGEISGTIDIPVTVKLFHTDGGIYYGAEATVFGPAGDRRSIPLVLDTFPVVGDPHGLVSVTGHFTLNMQDALTVGVPQRGWFNVRVFVRTAFTNGDTVDTETWIPLYSLVDQTAPEVNVGGLLGARCSARNPNDTDPVPWGFNQVEFHQMLPILTDVITPQVVQSFGYAYASTPEAQFQPPTFDLLLDADFHMGIPGTVVPMTATGILDGLTGFNRLNPAAMSTSATPMGLLPRHHRWTFQWGMDSGAGFNDRSGHVSGGQQLRSLLSVVVTVGDHPTDDGPATLWTVEAIPPAPPPIVPPVIVPPPPIVTPPWIVFLGTSVLCQNTATGQLELFALASCSQVP